jgi:hypothetical protein
MITDYTSDELTIDLFPKSKFTVTMEDDIEIVTINPEEIKDIPEVNETKEKIVYIA